MCKLFLGGVSFEMNYIGRDDVQRAEPISSGAQPFLKWAGGKRWLFKKYRHLFPRSIDRLIDPFLGGGSSFFYLQPKTALLADLNQDLIDLYLAVRDSPGSLAKLLVHYHHAHCKAFYYSTRAEKPTDPIRKAAWILYLNRTCWNGLFRVNLKGEFNVPIGTKTKVFSSLSEFNAASLMLKTTKFIHSDFEAIINQAVAGDVVFADPPYFEKNRNIRFLKYNANVFSWPDHVRLRDSLIRARKRGAICFVTNADHKSLVKLYSGVGKIHYLSRQSVVSGSNSGRKTDKELLVEI